MSKKAKIKFKPFRCGARAMTVTRNVTQLEYRPSEALQAMSKIDGMVMAGQCSARSGAAFKANINRRCTLTELPRRVVAVIGSGIPHPTIH